MKKTLVIMAAGIGSRFGGVKQLAKVGPKGEVIIDYAMSAALKIGFDKIVFIIRRDIEKDFKEVVGERMENLCEVEYVYQSTDDIPKEFAHRFDRTKPWGTGQAILACKDAVKEPFAVINADDYYGTEAFQKIYDYLYSGGLSGDDEYCMAGFRLKNTLSDNGGVTRGVCQTDENDYLVKVTETSNLIKTENGAAEDTDGQLREIDPDSYVSMNMWGFTPKIFEYLERMFGEFLADLEDGDNKSEFLIPTVVDELIRSDRVKVKLLETNDKWLGITYKEDLPSVREALKDVSAE